MAPWTALLLLTACARAATPLGGRADALPVLLSTNQGLKVHRSCLEGESPENRGQLRVRLEEAIRAMRARSAACQADLDGLEYLQQGRAALAQTILLCAPSDQDPKFKYGWAAAYTVYRENMAGRPVIQALARENPDAYFMVVRDGLRAFLDRGPLYVESSLFHESAHNTQANSRWDHNEIESISFDSNQPCVRNKLDDRIVLLEAACGFFPSEGTNLRTRIRKCGREIGCEVPLWMVANVPYASGDAFREDHYGEQLMRDPARVKRVCRGIKTRLGKMARAGEMDDEEALDRIKQADRSLAEAVVRAAPGEPKASTPEEEERERSLQLGTAQALARLRRLARGESEDAVAVGLSVVDLYQRHCPASVREFRPVLCLFGEAAIVSAALDVRDLVAE